MLKTWKGFPGVTALLLAAAVVLGACGTENKEGQPVGDDGGKSGNSNYEIVMTYPAFGDVSDVQSVQNAISEITSEKIGATVKLVPINGSNYANQINLMLSGSEKLDLAYSSIWFGFESQISRGQLLPMDKYLTEYGKGILDAVPEEAAEAGKLKGETYGVPSIKAWALTPSLVMSKELVEKHGIDTSGLKTWSDAGPVLQVIKDKEPGVAPIVSYTAMETPGNAMLYFDPLGNTSGVLNFEGSDYRIQNMAETSEFAEMTKLMREWYEAGYFNKDVATTQETGSSQMKSGKAFSFIRNINDCYTESVAAGVDLVCVPLESSYMTRNSVSSNMMSLARNSENPEKAIQFMALLYTDEAVINLFTNGVEGKHYVKKDDGLIAKPEGVTGTGYDSNQFAVGNNFLSYVWEGNDPDIWANLKELNESAVKSRAMGFSFDINSVKSQVASVTNVMNQYDGGLQTGTSDPALLAEYAKKLKEAGIERIIAEKQKQLDEWLKLK
jgi:putative aldouronate transport system substrate-binding protein